MTFAAQRSGDGKFVEITDEWTHPEGYFSAIYLTLDTDDRSAEVASDQTVERIVHALNREFYSTTA